jgi:uncharacterized Zn-finger protein
MGCRKTHSTEGWELTKKKCPYCPKKYQSPNDLDAHLQKIHGLTPAKIKEHSKEEQSEFVKKCVKILDEMEKQKR